MSVCGQAQLRNFGELGKKLKFMGPSEAFFSGILFHKRALQSLRSDSDIRLTLSFMESSSSDIDITMTLSRSFSLRQTMVS